MRNGDAPWCHPEWQPSQAEIAAEGGAGRRSAKNADSAVESIARSAPLGAAAPLPRGGPVGRGFCGRLAPRGGMTSGDPAAERRGGTRVAGVGTRVGTSVPTSVGVDGLGHGGSWAGTGRAAELASEAARAEGASPPRHRPWPARQGPGQAVKDEWLRRPEPARRRGAGHSPLTAGHRAPPAPPLPGRAWWPVRRGRGRPPPDPHPERAAAAGCEGPGGRQVAASWPWWRARSPLGW